MKVIMNQFNSLRIIIMIIINRNKINKKKLIKYRN